MKIVVLLSRVPYPLEKGDKLRAYHQVKHLAQHHDVILYCLCDKHVNDEAIEHLRSFCREVRIFRLSKWKIAWRLFTALFGSLPFQVSYFTDRVIRKKIVTAIRYEKPDRIYCQLIRMCEYVKDMHDINKTLDYMDVFSKGMQRRIHSSSFLFKPFVKTEFRRLILYENRMFDYFEKKIIISEQDRDLIPHKDRQHIAVVPNGVDTGYFQADLKQIPAYELLFHGNLSYAPNVECVRYIVQEILPALYRKGARCRLLVSGASPARKVKSFCASSKNVHLAGWVNDVRSSYSDAKILLAPFTTGSGLQNKLLEAMSMEMACVTSTLCFNALEGALGGRDIMVADTTEEIADTVIQLLNNDAQRKSIGAHGRSLVLAHYAWEPANAVLEKIIEK